MALTNDEAQQIGRIEAKLDFVVETMTTDSTRISALEAFANRAKGVLAFLSLAASILAGVLLLGCAHSHTRTYYADGSLKCSSATTVLGQGQVEVLVESEDCPDTIYESTDTGISDNGRETVGEIAEGVSAGVMKGMIP